MSDRRQGLTDADFDKLARERDAKLDHLIEAACDKRGVDRTHVAVHISGTAGCYCACPEGPCQHDWTGPERDLLDDQDNPCGMERTCARCGMGALSHDLRVLP